MEVLLARMVAMLVFQYISSFINACGVLVGRSEEHTSELQSPCNLVCRLLLEKKKKKFAEQAQTLQGRVYIIFDQYAVHDLLAVRRDLLAKQHASEPSLLRHIDQHRLQPLRKH